MEEPTARWFESSHGNKERQHKYISERGGMEEQLAYMLELNAYLDDWAIP